MIPLKKALASSVLSKTLTALTGIGLVVFIITHLAGNLTMLVPGGQALNAYALKLEDLGPLKTVGQIGLIVLFGLHIVNGILLKLNHKAARPIGYTRYESKGGESLSSPASRSMAISGSILLVFVILHVFHFSKGPGIEEGYVTQLNGREARDLYRLVVEQFRKGWVVALYVGAMIFLTMHLRHGIWSAWQSIGLLNKNIRPVVVTFALLLALVLGLGFLALPLIIYFNIGGVVL